MNNRRTEAGFSLVELMVTVVVVAILGSMAVAAYSNYVMKANRTDATRAMLADSQALQRCYSQNFTYTPPGGCPTPAGTTSSPRGLYSITIATPSATAYTITATPAKTPQTKDTACMSFKLTSDGAQSSANSAAPTPLQPAGGRPTRVATRGAFSDNTLDKWRSPTGSP